ncbi:MAG: hypothetical protein ACO3LG_10200, partial [Ilumatobacteraceae bacterium]
HPERSPHVRRSVEAAAGFGRNICTLDADEAAGRDQMMIAAREANPVDVGGVPMPSLSGSNLVTDGAGQLLDDGRRGERTIDELLDGRWAVIGSSTSLTDEDRAVLSSLDAVAIDESAQEPTIVRPDRIVFGIGRAALDALADVVNRYKLFG